MNIAYVLGVVCGLLVGGLLIFLILKLTKKDGNVKCKYDERQELARGKGYKIGFFTVIIYSAVYMILSETLHQYFEPGVLLFIGICLGVFAYAAYCIWNEAYIALNENPKRMTIAFLLIAVINLVGTYPRIVSGELLEDGKVSFGCVNLICAILLILVVLTLAVKKLFDKRTEEEA